MRIAITGASGFVGRAVVAALGLAGHAAVPLNLRTAGMQAAAGAEAVVHLAAIAHRRVQSAQELRRVNVELTRDVGRAAAAAGIQMIFLSSIKVHGNQAGSPVRETSPIAPEDPYGESKALAEETLRAISGLRLTILRPPLVYGPGVKANFLTLMSAVAKGMPLPLSSVINRRSLVFVGNLADAILRTVGAPGTFLVSDGRSTSTPDLCRAIGQALGK